MGDRALLSTRLLLILLATALFPTAILLQVLRIQILEGSDLKALWGEQAIDYVPIPAERGQIVDVNGRILVNNTVSYRVIVDPLAPRTTRDGLRQVARTLASHTGRSADHYLARINGAPRGSRYILLDRGVPRAAFAALRELNVRGLILEEEFKRRYNYGSLASHAIGFVNHEYLGMTGIEAGYHSFLQGQDGEQQVQRDRAGRIRAVVGAPRRRPVAGHTIRTTIDARIQAIVEQELEAGVLRARADRGTVIVLDPETGAIRAMANYPAFDPNQPASADERAQRNFAIADMIEPGSTFKLVTAVAAVEQGVLRTDEIFHTPADGKRLIHGQWMRDHDPLGSIDFRNVIQKSSNVATAEIAMRLDNQSFYQYARNFGFGNLTGIDIPNEAAGRLQRPFEWSKVTLPWMSIGYEVQVTPLQMAMAYAAFANEGVLMRPYLVEEVLDENGNVVQRTRPNRVRQVVRPETIRELTPVFEGVLTENGTAEFASVEGVRIAGKTGTAQKFVDGRYRTRYRATFVGFYPTDDPKYVCLVLLDEPRTSIYGGYVSGPIFRNITSRMMGLDERLRRDPVVDPDTLMVVVPRLEGFTRDQAETLLDWMDLEYDFSGSGPVINGQDPAPGGRIRRNSEIRLVLGGTR